MELLLKLTSLLKMHARKERLLKKAVLIMLPSPLLLKAVIFPSKRQFLKVIDEVGKESIGVIKSRLGDEYSYGDIRLVLSHLIWEGEMAKQST